MTTSRRISLEAGNTALYTSPATDLETLRPTAVMTPPLLIMLRNAAVRSLLFFSTMERGIINRPPQLLASPDLNGHLHGPEFREIAGKLKKRKGVFYTKIPKLRQIWSRSWASCSVEIAVMGQILEKLADKTAMSL